MDNSMTIKELSIDGIPGPSRGEGIPFIASGWGIGGGIKFDWCLRGETWEGRGADELGGIKFGGTNDGIEFGGSDFGSPWHMYHGDAGSAGIKLGGVETIIEGDPVTGVIKFDWCLRGGTGEGIWPNGGGGENVIISPFKFDVLPSYADMFLPGAFESDNVLPTAPTLPPKGDDDEAEDLGGVGLGIEGDWGLSQGDDDEMDNFGGGDEMDNFGGGDSGGNWGIEGIPWELWEGKVRGGCGGFDGWIKGGDDNTNDLSGGDADGVILPTCIDGGHPIYIDAGGEFFFEGFGEGGNLIKLLIGGTQAKEWSGPVFPPEPREGFGMGIEPIDPGPVPGLIIGVDGWGIGGLPSGGESV